MAKQRFDRPAVWDATDKRETVELADLYRYRAERVRVLGDQASTKSEAAHIIGWQLLILRVHAISMRASCRGTAQLTALDV